MTKSYTHLTQEERYHIHALKAAGFSTAEIAQLLGRHVSTIRRELKRNTGLKGYRPQQAHNFAKQRQQMKPKALKMTKSMQQHIINCLALQWSPEQISGRLKLSGEPSVSPQTIYTFIAQDKADGGDLHKQLRHKKYRKRTSKPDARGQILDRVSIDERPEVVDKKLRLGDWEADTVVGKGHQGFLVTLTERVSKLNLIAHVPTKHAELVTDAMLAMLEPYQKTLKSITFDNGKEFAYHYQLKEVFGVDTYFAHPYHSWERGLNENHNGLIRQYLPKGQALDQVTHEQVLAIQSRLNQRPRKTLGFKTPEEVYTEMALAA